MAASDKASVYVGTPLWILGQVSEELRGVDYPRDLA